MSNIKELIRQEIERRKEELERDKYINIDAKACRHSELKFLERFIDSLPDENNPEPYNPVYDEDYLNEKIAKATKSWEGVDVDAYMDEVRGREPEQPSEN